MAKFLFFNDGNDNALTMPASRLLGIEQTGDTSIALLFEDKDGTAGAVTTVTLTIATGKEKQVMENLADIISSSSDVAVVFDSTITDVTGRDVTGISIDDAGTNSNGLTAGSGITNTPAAVYNSWIEKNGNVIKTSIYIDLTDLHAGADGDIIGTAGDPNCHIGQITAAKNGTIFAGRLRLLETITGAADDIDVFSAAEGTGVEDTAISALTETSLFVAGGALSTIAQYLFTDLPAADEYLYLAAGELDTGDYTGGKILIELFGTV